MQWAQAVARWALTVGVVVLVPALGLAQETIQWRESWPDVQAAAQKSGRPILAYIYQHNHAACVEMDRTSFLDPAVISALNRGFELLAVNATSSRAKSFLDTYKAGVRSGSDKGLESDFAAIPGYLLLEGNGRECFRAYGYYPPVAFAAFVQQLGQLVSWQGALARAPQDALAHARLGRLYLELERPELGKPLLERARELDPQDALGARSEADLDLTILAIPDDPLVAFGRLTTYRFTHPQSPRSLEVQYYMAVAQLAAERADQCEQILLDFASIPPKLADGTDNPVYRDPWVVRADLLLRQLREARKGPAPQPRQ